MITTDSRINFLKEVAKHLPKNPICIELGVLRGEFSTCILEILKPKVLHLVDPWVISNDKNGIGSYGSINNTAYASNEDYCYVNGRFLDKINSGKVVVNKNFSYDAVKDFPNKHFDFIYIDACHLYESVKCDLRDYLPKLKAQGMMCGHDYVNVNNFGVIRAVNEFIDENKFEFLILNESGRDCWDWGTKRRIK